MLNALQLQGKKVEDCKVVCLGAGAAGVACSTFLLQCGVKPENFYMIDRHGVIRSERTDLNEQKKKFITPALLICYLCQFYIAAVTKSYNFVFSSFIHLNNYLSIKWIMYALKCKFF